MPISTPDVSVPMRAVERAVHRRHRAVVDHPDKLSGYTESGSSEPLARPCRPRRGWLTRAVGVSLPGVVRTAATRLGRRPDARRLAATSPSGCPRTDGARV